MEPFLAAIQLHSEGRLSEAADAYRNILEINPNDLASLGNLAKIIDPVDALDCYITIFEVLSLEGVRENMPVGSEGTLLLDFPKATNAAVERALELGGLGKKTAGQSILGKVHKLRAHIEDITLLIRAGRTAAFCQGFPLAVDFLTQVFDAGVKGDARVDVAQWLGMCCGMVGDVDGAIRYKEIYLEGLPEDRRFYTDLDLAKNHISKKNYATALDYLKQADKPWVPQQVLTEIFYFTFLVQVELAMIAEANITSVRLEELYRNMGDSPVAEETDKALKRSAIDAKIGGRFRMADIKSVVSFGGNCDVGSELKKRDLKFYSPFDWLVSPLKSVGRILASEGRDFLTQVEIDYSTSALGFPKCRAYNVVYMHDFPRNHSGHAVVNDVNLKKARTILSYKMRALGEYFSQEAPVLIIRVSLGSTSSIRYGSTLDEGLTSADINELVEQVQATYKTKDFFLLFFYDGEKNADFDFSQPLDHRVVLIKAGEGLSPADILDDYVESHGGGSATVKSNHEHVLLEMFRSLPENLYDILQALVGANEFNMLRVVLYFLQTWLDRYGATSPDKALALYHLGLTHAALGETVEAVQALRLGMEELLDGKSTA